jgi:hypothetical protein
MDDQTNRAAPKQQQGEEVGKVQKAKKAKKKKKKKLPPPQPEESEEKAEISKAVSATPVKRAAKQSSPEQLAAEMAELIDRALDGVSGLVDASETLGKGRRRELNGMIDKARRYTDDHLGHKLASKQMEKVSEMLFDAIDAVRQMEIAQAELDEEGVTGVLQLLAILDEASDHVKFEHTAAFRLRMIARSGDAAAIRELLNKGMHGRTVHVDVASPGGYTALMEAAQYGRTNCVSALLDEGADVNAVRSLGCCLLLCKRLCTFANRG